MMQLISSTALRMETLHRYLHQVENGRVNSSIELELGILVSISGLLLRLHLSHSAG